MKKSQHDRISEKLAKKENTAYNKGKGPDVIGKNRTIEVVTHESDLYSSIDQVDGFQKPYFATTSELINKALNVTKGTGIGVMNSNGKIIKRTKTK